MSALSVAFFLAVLLGLGPVSAFLGYADHPEYVWTMAAVVSLDAIQAIPYSEDPGYEALVNARRAAFIAELLGRAVGDDCITLLTHILDHVHYDVLEYLGETGEEEH